MPDPVAEPEPETPVTPTVLLAMVPLQFPLPPSFLTAMPTRASCA